MSSQQGNFSSSGSISFSSSSSTQDGQTTGQSRSQHVVRDPSGTTVTSNSQSHGEPAMRETRHYDTQGRELLNGGAGDRITDADQEEKDREYEERIEDEYAKREGGA